MTEATDLLPGLVESVHEARGVQLRVFSGGEGPALLLDAARRLEALDPASARETYLQALGAAMYAGRVDADSGVLEVAWATLLELMPR